MRKAILFISLIIITESVGARNIWLGSQPISWNDNQNLTVSASEFSSTFAEGASQGGALTHAAAALSDGRINAIAPAVPFMGDFPNYFQITSWPANVANAKRVQQS